MKNFYGSKKAVAAYVKNQRLILSPGSVLTTIITQGLLGGYSVTTVTDGSSEDIEHLTEKPFYPLLQLIYKAPIQAG